METTTKQKPSLSRYVATLLFLSIVYAPLVPAWLSMGDMDWMGMYASEAYAWVLILSGLDVLIIINAYRLYRYSRIFAVLSVVMALVPLKLALFDLFAAGSFTISSKLDTDPIGGMVNFWYEGGGYLMGVLTIPLAFWYVVLLVKGQGSRHGSATSNGVSERKR